MAVKVTDGIVHHKKKNYKKDEVIKTISKKDEERLINLGVAVHVDIIELTGDSDDTGSTGEDNA